MTREEIIQKGEKKFPPDIIEEIREDGSIARIDVNATVRHAYIQGLIDNNCQLPSNLDGAAEKFARFYDNGTCDGIAQECFKAGAEWMAGQGETFETEISNIGMLSLPELNIQAGDKVTVQIRKK